jgi:hypothetical protein
MATTPQKQLLNRQAASQSKNKKLGRNLYKRKERKQRKRTREEETKTIDYMEEENQWTKDK